MYDYIDSSDYALSGMMIFASLILIMVISGKNYEENRGEKESYIPLLLIFLSIAGPLTGSLMIKNSIDENLAYFKNAVTLECRSGLKSMLVSKKRGWEIVTKDSFSKNDIIIRADRCEIIELREIK